MSAPQFYTSVAVVPVTTIIAVLIGVVVNALIVNRRFDEIKDLIKTCAERQDANQRRMEERLSAAFTRAEETINAGFRRVKEAMNAGFRRVEEAAQSAPD